MTISNRCLSTPTRQRRSFVIPFKNWYPAGHWQSYGRISTNPPARIRRPICAVARVLRLRTLLAVAPVAEGAFTKWFDGEALKKRKNPLVRDDVLDEPRRIKPESGRAPYTRQVMREACEDVFQRGIHPADEGGVLFRNEAIRTAQLRRALDEQTNNHLVRHRLKLLERLHADILKVYAGAEKSRVARVTIEVNRDLKELSGKTAQEQAKNMGQRLANFKSVVKKLKTDFEGRNVQITPGLIRKARIAEDSGGPVHIQESPTTPSTCSAGAWIRTTSSREVTARATAWIHSSSRLQR